MLEDILQKINFVEELNKVITKVQKNIVAIHYDVFQTNNRIIYEFVVIEYVGGSRTVRNCTGNSCSAILSEISRYLDHGYYNEEDIYSFAQAQFKLVKNN